MSVQVILAGDRASHELAALVRPREGLAAMLAAALDALRGEASRAA